MRKILSKKLLSKSLLSESILNGSVVIVDSSVIPLDLTFNAANSTTPFSGSSGEATISDDFAYDFDAPNSALPTNNLPANGWYGNATVDDTSDSVLAYTHETVPFIADRFFILDVWGRPYQTQRSTDFDVALYNGVTLVDQVTAQAISTYEPNHVRIYIPITGEFDNFKITGHMTSESTTNYFTIMELRANVSELDITLPTVTISPIPDANVANQASLPISGTGEIGADDPVVTVLGETPFTVSLDGSGNWSTNIDVTNLPNIDLLGAVEVSQTNVSGTTSITGSLVKDAEPPVIFIDTMNIATSSNEDAFAITGTATIGDNDPILTITGIAPITLTVASDGTWTTTQDISGLTDGSIGVSLTQTDWIGNSTTTARTLFKETTDTLYALPVKWCPGDTVIQTGLTPVQNTPITFDVKIRTNATLDLAAYELIGMKGSNDQAHLFVGLTATGKLTISVGDGGNYTETTYDATPNTEYTFKMVYDGTGVDGYVNEIQEIDDTMSLWLSAAPLREIVIGEMNNKGVNAFPVTSFCVLEAIVRNGAHYNYIFGDTIPSEVNTTNSTVTTSLATTIADGRDVTITVDLKDGASAQLTGLNVGLLQDGNATIGNVNETATGIYEFIVSNTTVEDVTFTPIADGVTLSTVSIDFEAGEVLTPITDIEVATTQLAWDQMHIQGDGKPSNMQSGWGQFNAGVTNGMDDIVAKRSSQGIAFQNLWNEFDMEGDGSSCSLALTDPLPANVAIEISAQTMWYWYGGTDWRLASTTPDGVTGSNSSLGANFPTPSSLYNADNRCPSNPTFNQRIGASQNAYETGIIRRQVGTNLLVKPENYRRWHGWTPVKPINISPGHVKGIYGQSYCRLVMVDPNGPDNRHLAKWVSHGGCDSFTPTKRHAGGNGSPSYNRVMNYWRPICYINGPFADHAAFAATNPPIQTTP